MRTALVLVAVLMVSLAEPVLAHRIDEYLQATTISLEQERIGVEIRLTPGVEVFRAVFAKIDTDGDGSISRGRATRVRRSRSPRPVFDARFQANPTSG